MHLPEVDGFALLEAIRADEDLTTVPVVSTSTDPRMHPASVSAHVQLPGDVSALSAILLGLCQAE